MPIESPTLPTDWRLASLGELADKPQYGLTASAAHKEVGPRFLRITDIQNGAVNWQTVPYCNCSDDDLHKCSLRPDDLVIARIGATTGKAYLIEAPPKAVFASYLIRIRTNHSELLPEYLAQFTNTSAYWRQINETKGGRLKQGVNIPNLQQLKIPLPPLPEQRAIAHVLRTIQNAKGATEKIIAAARELKKSLMKHLFTYGPVSFQEADKVPLRITDFGPVPSAWDTKLLDHCAVVQTGVAKGRKLNGDEAITLPYLRVANVQDGYLDLAEMKTLTIRRREVDRYSLQAGDVVLTEGGDFDKLGRGFIWNGEVPSCIHQNHIFAVRPNRDLLSPNYLAYLTQSGYGKSYFLSVAHKTTNLACINTTKLKALPTLLPTIQEQETIAATLASIDAKVAVEVTRRNALDALFRSLLSSLMTGETRVQDIDFPELEETLTCP